MDPQLQQALLEALGRVVQIIESAGSQDMGDMPEDMPPEGMDEDMADMPMDEDMGGGQPEEEGYEDEYADEYEDEEYADEPMPGEMPPDDMPLPQGSADDGTESGGSLHNRVRRLEQHVGLRKALSGLPFHERLDALERHFLGEEYVGDTELRVRQLEKAAAQASAPEVIRLDDLIKAAVKEGARQVLDEAFLPDLGRARQKTRRRALPTSVSSAEDLAKAASDGEKLGLADALLYQWHLKQGGGPLGWEDGEDNNE